MGHASNRARDERQAAAEPGVIEAEDGSVHRLTATTLVIPEEKRCIATTVRGARCKAGRMSGYTVCVFHSHQALTSEGLQALADGTKPHLTPRAALKNAVQLQAIPLADAAVRGALETDGPRATSAVLALVDAVDPLVSEEATLSMTEDGLRGASLKQLRQVFGSTQPQ